MIVTIIRVFKSRVFSRFASQNSIEDRQLCDVITRAKRGLIDVDLGSGVIKQRVARQGAGRSGGFRTIILFRTEERTFFAYGFAKNKKPNIEHHHVKAFKLMAKTALNNTNQELQTLLHLKEIIEVNCDEKSI